MIGKPNSSYLYCLLVTSTTLENGNLAKEKPCAVITPSKYE